MDAVSAISADFRALRKSLAEIDAGQGDCASQLAEVETRLRLHAAAEEEAIYPELVRRMPGQASEIDQCVAEHREAEQMLARVESVIGTKEFDGWFAEFAEAVVRHIEEEELGILPLLREAMDRRDLEELGRRFEELVEVKRPDPTGGAQEHADH